MEINESGKTESTQAMEANKSRMREQIEAASENFPLSKWFLKNETLPSGLNLRDYVEVQRFPNSARIRDIKEYAKEDIAEFLGDVFIGEQKVATVGDLWGRFLESRRNLVKVFSEGKFSQGPRLEDFIMIEKMFHYDLLENNLTIKEVRDTTTMGNMKNNRSTQSVTHLFHDLSSFSYALPADKETEDFLVNVPGTDGHAHRRLGETEEFLRERKGEGALQVYDSFKKRFLIYAVPEFDERFWKQLVEERGGWKGDDPERDRRLLSEVGVPDAIIEIDNNPSLTLHVLQDTLKNSVGGSVNIIYSAMRQRGKL